MLAKLFKHEMRATARTFLPLLGLMFIFTLVNKVMYSDAVFNLLWSRNMQIISGILYFVTSAVYGILIGAVFIATILVLIQRFHKNLLGDEGYLMNTLPASSWQHITAKLLTSGIWGFVNSVAALIAILIMALEPQYWGRILPDFWYGLQWMAEDLGVPTFVLLLELLVAFLISLFGGMLPIYASISAGQQFWKKHKVLGAIIVFITTNTLTWIIYVKVIEFIANNTYHYNDPGIFHFVLWISVGLMAAWYAACFWFANRHLSKNLNLE